LRLHFAALLFVAACGSSTPDAPPADPAEAALPEGAPRDPASGVGLDGPPTVMLGNYTATLTATESEVAIALTDADGKAMGAAGQVRMMIKAVGEPEQLLLLSPDGNRWATKAKAAGASAYLVAAQVPVDGDTMTARFAWGDISGGHGGPPPGAHGPGDGHGHGGEMPPGHPKTEGHGPGDGHGH